MSWSRLPSARASVAVGDEITVKVLRVDDATGKISLGLKQLLDDPWSAAAARFEVGQVRTGRVTRVAEFGAFVELEPGIEGLAHASTFAPTGSPRGWARAVPPGTTAAFEIVSIDVAQKRIGLTLVEEGRSRNEATIADDSVSPAVDVETKGALGSLGDKLRDALGKH
jgi:small subunit ribosomal protein S1